MTNLGRMLVYLAGLVMGVMITAAYYNTGNKPRVSANTPGQHNVWLHVDASCVATSTTDATGIEQLSYIQCGGHKK